MRGGVRQTVVCGSTAPGTSGRPGIGVLRARRRDRLLGRGLVDVREAHALHRIEVIQVAPEFLEAVRGRQRVGVVAEMVLAELAGVVAEIEQEFGERRSAGPQIGRAAGQLRGDHAGAQRIHAGEEGIAPGRAALLGVIVHEDCAFVADAIDVRRLADHQAAVVDARLHPADIVTHDEEDVGFLCRLLCRSRRDRLLQDSDDQHRRAQQRGAQSLVRSLCPSRNTRKRRQRSFLYAIRHDVILPFMTNAIVPRRMHRKPRWLVEVSTGSAWRAAGR